MQNIVMAEVGTTEQTDRLLRIHDDVVRSKASSPAVKIFPMQNPTSI
jgi:hypothetical protein